MGSLKLFAVPLLLLLVCTAFAGTTGMSHEEEVVRIAYAKLAYAVQLGVLYDAASTTPADAARVADEVRKKELHFTLSDIRTGNVSELVKLTTRDLLDNPDGKFSLFIGTASRETRESGGTRAFSVFAMTPQWVQQGFHKVDWTMPISKALPLIEKQEGGIHLARYCSYRVDVEFEERFRTYRAIVWFGTDAKGKEVIVPGDPVIGMNGGALAFFLTNPVLPDVITHSRQLRDTAAVHEWLLAHNAVACPPASKEACCDPSSLKCSTGGVQ